MLAPADEDAPLPPYVVPAGRAVPVRYNGSVARLSFGPVSAARVRRWLTAGEFDVLHVHEPFDAEPVAARRARPRAAPIVATFHTAMTRSRAMRGGLGRAAAGAGADHRPDRGQRAGPQGAGRAPRRRRGGDPQRGRGGPVRHAEPLPGWPGEGGAVGFLGRFTEPRKGFAGRCSTALARLAPHAARAAAAGRRPRRPRGAARAVPPAWPAGSPSSAWSPRRTRRGCCAASTCTSRPNTGGESFGMILTEAMAAGTPVVASDLDAFRRVLDGGRAGALFPTGDAARWPRRWPGCSTTRPGGACWPPRRRGGGRATTGRSWPSRSSPCTRRSSPPTRCG